MHMHMFAVMLVPVCMHVYMFTNARQRLVRVSVRLFMVWFLWVQSMFVCARICTRVCPCKRLHA